MNSGRLVYVCLILLIASCAPTRYSTYDRDLLLAYDLIERAEAAAASERSKALVAEARSFYTKAERSLDAERRDEAMEYLAISQIKAKEALTLAESENNQRLIEELTRELSQLNSKLELRKRELSASLATLEFLKGKMNLSLQIMRKNASDGIDKAFEELSRAKDASADLISPVYFAQAMKAFEDSKESFRLGSYEESLRQSNDAYGYSLRAYEDSKEKLAFREQVADKLSAVYGIRVEKKALGVRILFDRLFSPNGDRILFDAYPSIDATIDVLRTYPDLELALYAYSASLQSEQRNINLSKRRMDAVYNYIVSRGLDGSRFTKKEGLGSGKDKGAPNAQVEIEATLKIPYTPPPEGTPPPIEAPGRL